MAKFKTLFTNANIDYIKEEVDKSLIEIHHTDFETLEDEVAMRTIGMGGKVPYIISSIEDKINTTVTVLDDTIEQLKAIRNEDGYNDFVVTRCDTIKVKLSELQEYYRERTSKEVTHRFKDHTMYNKKGDPFTYTIECATKEQQIKQRSGAQRKILKILTALDYLLQEEEAKRLKGNMEMPERMTYKTKKRGEL